MTPDTREPGGPGGQGAAAHPPTQRGTVVVPVRTPRWAVVLGVVAMVFALGGGAFGLVTTLTPLISGAASTVTGSLPAPQRLPLDTVAKYAYQYAAMGVAILLVAMLLLTGGIGLLMARRWSVPVLLTWAALKVMLAAWEVALAVVIHFEQMRAFQAITVTPPTGGVAGVASWVNLVFQGFNLAFKCALPVVVVWWLMRRRIREQTRTWA